MVLSVLVIMTLLVQDDPKALIEKLRSDDIAVREAAISKLKKLGATARPALEMAAKDSDTELAARADYLLQILQLKAELPANLQRLIPDVADRLAGGAGPQWTAVFLEAVAVDENGNRKLPSITREDLVPLVAKAIRGAVANEDKVMTCFRAFTWRLNSALPEMRKLVGDPDSHVRMMALVWMSGLGGGEAAASAAELLGDEVLEVRRHASNSLAFIGSKSQAEALRAALKDPDPQVRLNTAKALGKLGDRTAVDSILPLLDTNLRAAAVKALAELGCKEHVDKIDALLKEDGTRQAALLAYDLLDARDRADSIAKYLETGRTGTRGLAAMVLGSWKSRAYADRIADMVKNKAAGEYHLGITALGRMGDPRHAKTLVPMLKDGSNYMRADAAEALELLDARDCAGNIAALLKDPDSHARSYGILALGKLAARMPEVDRKAWIEAIHPLEGDESENVRLAASISLVRLGAKSPPEVLGIVRRFESTLFESWLEWAAECTYTLIQVHEPASYEKLMREIELKRSIESPEALTAALGDAGLKLVNSQDLMLNGRMGAGRVIRPLDLLKTLVVPAWGLIVEKDSVRLVSRAAAVEYWRKRLDPSGK